MSEQKKSYMRQLDDWSDENVIRPIYRNGQKAPFSKQK